MLFEVLISIPLFLCFIILLGRYNNYRWKKRGVVFYNGNRLTSPIYDFFTGKKPFFIHLHNIYKKYPNEPAIGIGLFSVSPLYVKDPTNVQCILSSDFNSFYHRGIETNETDILSKSTLFQNGKKWKLLRETMTPLFTSSKLKNMFYIMDKSAQDFVKHLKEDTELRKYNMYHKLSMFCSAAICATVFGVSTKSIFDSPFLKAAQRSLRPTLKTNIRMSLASTFTSLFKLLNVHFFKEYEDFFIDAIEQVIRQRELENVKKHDFVDIWLALKKKGTVKDTDNGVELEISNGLLAAQAFSFLMAGVEPTATAMFATILELAKNPDIQKKVQLEVDSVLKKHNGKLVYEVSAEMVFLDMVINEAMRLHPSVPILSRKCVEKTILPIGNIVVEKGTKIFIPVYEFHHDPKFFPDPEEFKPERFSRENKHKIPDITYLPFGKGNRTCVGSRYAHMQAKTGLIYLLHNFTFTTNVGKEKMVYSKHLFQLRLDHVHVEFHERQ